MNKASRAGALHDATGSGLAADARAPCGRADAQPAVEQRDSAAGHHHQRAAPDQRHQRLPPDAHDDAAVGRLVAERDIELAQAHRPDAGLGRRHLPRPDRSAWTRLISPSGFPPRIEQREPARGSRCSSDPGPARSPRNAGRGRKSPSSPRASWPGCSRSRRTARRRCRASSGQARDAPAPCRTTERGRPARRRSIVPSGALPSAGFQRQIGQRAEHQPDGEPDAERGEAPTRRRRRAA